MLVFGVVSVIVVASVVIAFRFQVRSHPPIISESYIPCIQGHSGFQVTRQYPNPSTWTFELAQGSTGYVFYEYNVTKGLDLFLGSLNRSLNWTIWQMFRNGSNLIAEISGSTVTRVRYFVPNTNQPEIEKPTQTYALGVQLSLVDYIVDGNIVNATWSIKGLIPGNYPVTADDLPWLTFEVVSNAGQSMNATSETFPRTCDS